MSYDIRLATRRDVDALTEFYLLIWPTWSRHTTVTFADSAKTWLLHSEASNEGNESSNPHILCTAALIEQGKLSDVYNVATHPHHRGQGLASRLMRHVFEHAKEQRRHQVEQGIDEADMLQSLVLTSSEIGIPLYRSLGFVDSALQTMQYTLMPDQEMTGWKDELERLQHVLRHQVTSYIIHDGIPKDAATWSEIMSLLRQTSAGLQRQKAIVPWMTNEANNGPSRDPPRCSVVLRDSDLRIVGFALLSSAFGTYLASFFISPNVEIAQLLVLLLFQYRQATSSSTPMQIQVMNPMDENGMWAKWLTARGWIAAGRQEGTHGSSSSAFRPPTMELRLAGDGGSIFDAYPRGKGVMSQRAQWAC